MATNKPRLLSLRKYAEHAGLSYPRIQALKNEGRLVLEDGKVDVQASDEKRAEYEEKIGLLISRLAVERESFDLVRAARDRLQRVGLRVADPVLAMDEKAEVVAKIDEEIDLALEDLVARFGRAPEDEDE
jgi:hypothetical protein